MEGEIRIADLVSGQSYMIVPRDPMDDFFGDSPPYTGTFERITELGSVKFTGVRNTLGDEIDHFPLPSGQDLFQPRDVVFMRIGDNGVGELPPKPWPQRSIPPGSEDVVYSMEITEGMDMVDFHGEYGHGRYYPLEVYTDLHLPKQNPITRQVILPAEVEYYTAHIAPAGGRRRRKTKKSSRRMRKTRRSRK
jgi:hypothetical protein